MKRMTYLKNVSTLQLDAGLCTGCGLCLAVCPQEVLFRENGRVRVLDRDRCMECGACARNCPSGAVTVQTGVGCAAAVINAALGRTGSGCCCVLGPETAARTEDRPFSCC
jgi:ferredoxin